jgi:20S proteasome alpha/beta subunit
VTIAAGFRYRTGILLLADTQHTYRQWMKLSKSKIVELKFPEQKAKIGVAIAGSVDFAIMATEKLEKKLKSDDISHEVIADSVEEVLLDIYGKHIHPFNLGNECGFDLLLAIWTEAEGLTFLNTSGTAITEIKDYGMIGIGLYLAQFLASTYDRHSMERDEVFTFAVDVFRKVKTHVDGCGGSTNVFLLEKDGESGFYSDTDVENIERFTTDFDQAVRGLRTAVSDFSNTTDDIENYMEIFKNEITVTRDEQKDRIAKAVAKRKRLFDSLKFGDEPNREDKK